MGELIRDHEHPSYWSNCHTGRYPSRQTKNRKAFTEFYPITINRLSCIIMIPETTIHWKWSQTNPCTVAEYDTVHNWEREPRPYPEPEDLSQAQATPPLSIGFIRGCGMFPCGRLTVS